MADMSQQEIAEYLAEAHVAHMVTIRSNGRPQVAPVWFLEDDGKAFVMADANAMKVRNIRRNPAVTLSIHRSEALKVCGFEWQCKAVRRGNRPYV